MKIKNFIIHNSLFIILLTAAVLRLWHLGSIPPGLTPDEASLGYNAYSILKIGRDQYGKILPIIFKSFGDYKPGLYVYLTVPSVALFGLSEFAVRLPGAIAGVIAVWLIYKIVILFFEKQKKFSIFNYQFSIGEITALLLAISPWHIYFSRGAWEANVSLTLTLGGIYFFLKSLKDSKFLIHASVFFSLTILTYQGAKLSTFIVFVVLAVVYWKDCKMLLKRHLSSVVKSALIGLVIAFPVILSLFQGKAGRLEVFSIFSYRRPNEQIQQIANQGNETMAGLSYKLYHTESLNYVRAILGRWFNHISLRFLIFSGDWQNPRHSAPNQGMLLLSDIILLTAGVIALIRTNGKIKYFVFLWLLLASLPAALSRDEVHAVRSLNMVIPLTLVSSVGLFSAIDVFKRIKNPFIHYSSFFILIATISGAMFYFLDSYFVHLPIHNAKYWFYGYKEAVEQIVQIQDKYKDVVFQQSYDQPYIYFLFYGKYDPARYQRQASLESGGIDVGLVNNLDNITFESFSWPYRTDRHTTLVVGDPVGIPANVDTRDYKLISEIKYPDGLETAFRIVEVK